MNVNKINDDNSENNNIKNIKRMLKGFLMYSTQIKEKYDEQSLIYKILDYSFQEVSKIICDIKHYCTEKNDSITKYSKQIMKL